MTAPIEPDTGSEKLDGPGWGHRSGLLDLRPADPATAPTDADRAALIERCARYAWGFDERRADLLEDCFTEDTTWSGQVAGGGRIGPHRGRTAVLEFMTGFWLRQHEQRRHLLLNHVIAMTDPNEAVVHSYHVLLAAEPTSIAITASGFYRMRMRVEHDGIWRISHVLSGYDRRF